MTPLRQRMINDMTVRGLANSTMASYLRSVTRLARHYRRSPDQISAPEVQAYLLFLHQQHGLCWTTCNTIRHGMRFFYRITLCRTLLAQPAPQPREPETPQAMMLRLTGIDITVCRECGRGTLRRILVLASQIHAPMCVPAGRPP